jgi:hypothetical protein
MDAEQRYHFQTFGFLVIPDVIAPATVAELLEVTGAHLTHPQGVALDSACHCSMKPSPFMYYG